MDIIEQANQVVAASGVRSPFRMLLSDMRYYARTMRRMNDAAMRMKCGDGSAWTVSHAHWTKAADKMSEKYGHSYAYKMRGVIIRCYALESMIL